MDFSKLKNKLLILLCCFVIVFPFILVTNVVNADSETVEFDSVSGLSIVNTRNYFASASSSVGYVLMEKGYRYTFVNNSQSARNLAYSNEIPELNGTYSFIIRLEAGESYSFIPDYNEYLYFDFSNNTSVTLTREKLEGMNNTINDLVENVGVNSIWNIFDISINYIVVVVVFALGCFIIFKLIKKVSKGKEGF